MKKTRIIAMYLPQFHRIPENDKWWGAGFTEWTNVRKATPLFAGHIQPREPLNQDYYDLSNKDVMLNHMNLAKEYGLDGFCFYHYWFKDGKRLLEKPIEALLGEDDIPLPFCLCWANEPWTRNWDGDEGSKVVLMEQEYGKETDWIEHFNYLKGFFSRDEYIKKDGKPVMVIYKPGSIPDFERMTEIWNDQARKNGLEGLFIIGVHRSNVYDEYPFNCDGVMDFEPFATLSNLNSTKLEMMIEVKKGYNGKSYRVYDYEKLAKHNCSEYKMKDINHYLGCFPGWDNTPRMGDDERVLKIVNNTVKNFKEYFRGQYKKSVRNNNEFMFINAWNEWGEGAYLEPDSINKYGYLESIKEVLKEEGDAWGAR